MTYIRAQKAQIDSWEALGNLGWNWDSLLPYYRKSEHFDVPTAAQVASGASFDQVYHGETGPLNVGFPYSLLNGTFTKDVQDSWEALGVPVSKELNGGDVRGISVAQSTLDRDANVREDAARAYYYPIKDRSNLRLFLNTTANRIVWESHNETAAKGIEVTHADGFIRVLNARKEVIISAGSLRSPAILELSGIGNPKSVLVPIIQT
jgi:choline dehydrogenase-like flavoprotein